MRWSCKGFDTMVLTGTRAGQGQDLATWVRGALRWRDRDSRWWFGRLGPATWVGPGLGEQSPTEVEGALHLCRTVGCVCTIWWSPPSTATQGLHPGPVPLPFKHWRKVGGGRWGETWGGLAKGLIQGWMEDVGGAALGVAHWDQGQGPLQVVVGRTIAHVA